MMRGAIELSLRWIIDGLKYLFQRDADHNEGELQHPEHPEHLEQQQQQQEQRQLGSAQEQEIQAQVQVQLPVTSTARSVTAPSPDILLSMATMGTAPSHSAIFQSSSTASGTYPQYSLTTITDSLREETMEGSTTNPVLVLTKHHEYMRHALEMVSQ